MVVEGVCKISCCLYGCSQSACIWCLCAGILYPWISKFYVSSLYKASLNSRYLNISGLGGLQSAYLIAFKQLVPEHTVTLFRSPIKMRVKVSTPALLRLIIALPRIISFCSSLVSTLPRNIRVIPACPHRLPRLMDLPPLLQTQLPRYPPNNIRHTNTINDPPRRCVRDILFRLLLPRQNSTSHQCCRYNDFQSPRKCRDMSTVESG